MICAIRDGLGDQSATFAVTLNTLVSTELPFLLPPAMGTFRDLCHL